MLARITHLIFAVASLLMLALGQTIASDSLADETYINAVWLAQSEGLVKLDASGGRTLLAHDLSDIQAVEVDELHGNVWACSRGKLYRFDLAGRKLAQYSVAALTLETNGGEIRSLVVDETDGSVWLAAGKRLLNISQHGELLATVSHKVVIESLAFGSSHATVWIAGSHSLYEYAVDSGSLTELSGLGNNGAIRDLVYDPVLEQLWVATETSLLKLSVDGVVQGVLEIRHLRDVENDIYGNIWAVTEKELLYIDNSGLLHFEVVPFGKPRGGQLVALAPNHADNSLWVANHQEVTSVSQKGVKLYHFDINTLSGSGQIHDLAVYADTISPELHIISPEENSYLNNNKPTLELTYSDIGSGVDLESIVLSVDDGQVSADCSEQEQLLICTLLTPLPEGANTVLATISDRAGNISTTPQEVTFYIDTTPPEISITHPDDGIYTNDAGMAIVGRLSESASVSVNRDPVELGADYSFGYEVSLSEGGNSIVVHAEDLAGNVASMELTVVLDTIAPVVPDTELISVGKLSGE